jgi:hypothetical protein
MMLPAAPTSRANVKAIFRENTLQFEVAAVTSLKEPRALLNTFGQGHGDLLLVEVCFSEPVGEYSAS